MDFIWLKHLIPDALQNNKDFLFGNIKELYEFHSRYIIIHIMGKKWKIREEQKSDWWNLDVKLFPYGQAWASGLESVDWIGVGWAWEGERSSTGSLRKKGKDTIGLCVLGVRHQCHISCVFLCLFIYSCIRLYWALFYARPCALHWKYKDDQDTCPLT